jgi:16S rRNA (guanine527-N7)-methyltransferase
MGEAFDGALEAGLRDLGLWGGPAASVVARRSYEAHARLLLAWGAVMNLTAVLEPAEVARRHICDSLSAVPRLAGLVGPGAALLDLGSGGGYPGLPLAPALQLGRVALVESVGKKARFLSVAAAAVRATLTSTEGADRDSAASGRGVPEVEAVGERAEDLADDPAHRGAWDVVTARAVGSLAEVVELAMPLTRRGGLVVAWKRETTDGGLRDELRDAGSIIRAAGGGRPEVVVVGASLLPGHRLVIVGKERPTPNRFPRPAAARRRR